MRKLRIALAMGLVAGLAATAHAGGFYQQTNLVSDGSVSAANVDPNLVNPWGIAHGPSTPWWVANNHSGTLTHYDLNGTLLRPVVQVPSPDPEVPGSPTGMVFNDTDGFHVVAGEDDAPARFVLATEDGTILGWSPLVGGGAQAIIMVDNSKDEAIYKGLALARNDCGEPTLYAANFHAGTVEMYDDEFNRVEDPFAFIDAKLPAGFAPFGIAVLRGHVFVTYALQDENAEDDVRGPGNGFIDEYTLRGDLIRRVASGGSLNSPWGLAFAPHDFGPFSDDLLVGNFGDGRINAFQPKHDGRFKHRGALFDANGAAIVIGDLWGIGFGNGGAAGPTNTLFFAAAIAEEAHGLFGAIQFVKKKVCHKPR